MSNTTCPVAPAALYPEADARESKTLAAFDTSLQLPVVLFALKAGGWLILGLLLALIGSVQLFNGTFLTDCEWFTHGRVQAAAETLLTFGWGGNALLGLAFWLLVRLTRRALPSPLLLIVGAIGWNFGVASALVGTLVLGDQTGFVGLQAPAYSAVIFAFSLFVFGAWALAALRGSGSDHSYVSEWFLLVAMTVFPWAYASGLLVSVIFPGRGVVAVLASTWTAHTVYGLWLAPAALAVIFYFLPKLSGRALPSYHLAVLGFWVWVVIAPWTGTTSLGGAPVPVWITAVGGAATLALLMAYTLLASGMGTALLNARTDSDGILPWIRFAALAFLVHGLLSVFPVLGYDSLRFTHFSSGLSFIGIAGVFSMAALGAYYYILPRVVGAPLPVPGLVGFHFHSSALAIVVGGFALCLGAGLSLGEAAVQVHDGKAALDYTQLSSLASTSLAFQSAALLILLVGAIAFHLQTLALWTRICPFLCACRSLRAN